MINMYYCSGCKKYFSNDSNEYKRGLVCPYCKKAVYDLGVAKDVWKTKSDAEKQIYVDEALKKEKIADTPGWGVLKTLGTIGGFILTMFFVVLVRNYVAQNDSPVGLVISFICLIGYIVFKVIDKNKKTENSMESSTTEFENDDKTVPSTITPDTSKQVYSEDEKSKNSEINIYNSNDSQRFCMFCGSRLDSDSVFCSVCGKRIE